MQRVSPEAVGLSSARLASLDNFLKQRYLDSGKLPHTHVLISRRDRVVHNTAQGVADVSRKRPLTDDALYRIYSMTKPVTSVAFMMLVEEGKTSLDEPVHRVIPEWRNLRVYMGGGDGAFETRTTAAPMRMVDLLRHTSGLTYGFQTRTPVDAVYRRRGIAHLPVLSLPDMIKSLTDVPLEFSPGEAWNYSVSTDVLGYVIEKVSGMPLAEFFRQRIFTPLGLNDTGFQVAAENASRLTACYEFARGGMTLQDDAATSPFLAPPAFVSGGGGLVSSASDYLKFCRMLLGGGAVDGVRLLSPKTVAFMTSNHLPGGGTLAGLSRSMFSESAYDGVGFGLGFAVTVDPVRTLIPGTAGDFYWGGMASTYFWIDPREELIVIFMTQLLPSTSYAIRRELRGLVYAAFTESFA